MSTTQTEIVPKQNANIAVGENPPGSLVPRTPASQQNADTPPYREDRPEDFEELTEYLLHTSEFIKSIDADDDLEFLRFIVKLRKFYAGKQVGRVSSYQNDWVNVTPKKGKMLYTDPQLSYFVDSALAQAVKQSLQIRVNARDAQRLDKVFAAKYATEMWADIERHKIKFSFNVREGKNYLLCGEAYRHTWHKRDVKGTNVRVPRHEKVTLKPTTQAWYCPLCMEGGAVLPEMRVPEKLGMGDAGVQNMPCPACGYKRVQVIGAGAREVMKHVGYEEIPAGDVEVECVDPIEMKASNKAYGIVDTPFLTRDRMFMRGILEDVFEGQVIPSATEMPHNLRLQRELERVTPQDRYEGATSVTEETPQRGRNTGGQQFELLHFREVWIDRALYTRYRFPTNTRMPNPDALIMGGKRLGDVFPDGIVPMGTRLRDLLPSGGYFCHVGNTILDIREENMADTWVHSCYYLGEGFHGIGLFALVPLQEQFNELRSLQFNKVMFDSVTQTLVRKSAIEGSKIDNDPAAVINVTNFPEEQPLTGVMTRVAPGREMVEAGGLGRELMYSAQNLVGNSSLVGGAPDLQGSPQRKALTTATGVSATQEISNSRFGPPLGLRAEMIQDQVVQALKLRQKNWPEEMYQSLDRKIGGDAGRWFREADIDRDFWVEVVPGTILPLTEEKKREDFQAILTLIPPDDAALQRAALRHASELFPQSGFDVDSYQRDTMEAQIRMDRVRALAAALEQGTSVAGPDGQPRPDLIGVVMQKAARDLKIVREMDEEQFPFCPVQPVLDRHDQYIQVYNDFLLSSEGRDASPFVRACVQGLIWLHMEGQVLQKQGATARLLEARLPEFFAQKMVAEEGAKGEQAKQEAQVKGDLAKQALKGNQELEITREKHAHDLATSEQERQLSAFAPPQSGNGNGAQGEAQQQ